MDTIGRIGGMEWKTIIRKRFVRNLLLAVFCIHVISCIYWFLGNKAVGEKDYIIRYHQNIEAVLRQSDSMNQISIFKAADGFSKRNIEKTADDYKKLLEIEPVSFDYRGLIALFHWNFVHFFGVLCILLVVFALTDRNTIGLKHGNEVIEHRRADIRVFPGPIGILGATGSA